MIDEEGLQKLNDKVYENGGVDREHLLEFLRLINTSDSKTIIKEVNKWLRSLHDSPRYTHVTFPSGDIAAILGDLDSYGRVRPETILRFKEQSNRNMV